MTVEIFVNKTEKQHRIEVRYERSSLSNTTKQTVIENINIEEINEVEKHVF